MSGAGREPLHADCPTDIEAIADAYLRENDVTPVELCAASYPTRLLICSNANAGVGVLSDFFHAVTSVVDFGR